MLVEASVTRGGIDLTCSGDLAILYRVKPPLSPA
jgi:hypothetical protein